MTALAPLTTSHLLERLPAFLTWELEQELLTTLNAEYELLLCNRFEEWLASHPAPSVARDYFTRLDRDQQLSVLTTPAVSALLLRAWQPIDYVEDLLNPATQCSLAFAPAKPVLASTRSAFFRGLRIEFDGAAVPHQLLGLEALDDSELPMLCDRIARSLNAIEEISKAPRAMVDATLRAAIVRSDTANQLGFSSSSWPGVIGTIALVNAHRSNLLDDAWVVDALVHESIHSVLYKIELFSPFYRDPDAARRHKISSPWTGAKLELHSYLHACFVWFGLWCFWSLGQESKRGSNLPCEFFRDRALKGFLETDLIRTIGPARVHLSTTLLDAIDALQCVVGLSA